VSDGGGSGRSRGRRGNRRKVMWSKLLGKFIVVDGPDGAGKSTQVRLLGDWLAGQGLPVARVRDPGGTAIGEQIRGILLNTANGAMGVGCEMLLYLASRAQLYEECIGPALAAGKVVLSDRWVSSTCAYQGAAGGLGMEAVMRVAEAALPRTWPDLTVILDAPSEVGLGRIGRGWDRMEGKGPAFHRRVREAFLELAGRRSDFRVVEASGPIDQVQELVRGVLEAYVVA